VRFVENIRGYIDILDWVATDSGPPAQREGAAGVTTTTTAATMSDSLPAPSR
jgi:hypothetical protein